MFGHNRNSGIHWLRDYGDAYHKYQSTQNIRGRIKEPMRPLGSRRSVDMYSIRLKDDGSMGVECVLYQTPVVTFYPTGLVEIRDGQWSTISTAYFIEEVTGYNARLFNNSLCVSVMGMETRLDGVLRIMNGHIENPVTDKAHYIKRTETNNVRKQYAEFLTYASAVVRLKAEGFTTNDMVEVFGKDEMGNPQVPDQISRPYYSDFARDMHAFFGFVKDTGEDKHLSHYKAVLALAHGFGSRTYATGYKYTGVHLTEDALKRRFNELMLGYHRDEVFGIKERQVGDVKRDPYLKYYEQGWKRLHQPEN